MAADKIRSGIKQVANYLQEKFLGRLKYLKKGLGKPLMASPVIDPRILVDSMLSVVTRNINQMAI